MTTMDRIIGLLGNDGARTNALAELGRLASHELVVEALARRLADHAEQRQGGIAA